jgi:thiamine pyridinylase
MSCSKAFPCLARARQAFLTIVVALVPALLPLPADAQETLTVALYPYVPRVDQFESAIRQAWQKVQPAVGLDFIKDEKEWDGGYKKDPPARAHVYVFDAMYFEQFRTKGLLVDMAPSEIHHTDDFLPYARDAVIVDGKYHAVPQLGCANILFYNVNDTALANATTLTQVQSALRQCTYTSEIPPDRRGLMLDMLGSTTNATLYLDIAHSANGRYPLPQPTTPDTSYIANGKTILALSSFLDITSPNPDAYVRGTWYSEGYGRAIVGFTETMSAMSSTALATIAFKVMPLSDTTGNPPLFFVDAVGVNKSAVGDDKHKRGLAVQLADIIAATDTMVASIRAAQPGKNPQYLMSVRNSVFQELEKDYPIYGRMYQLAQASRPVAFKLDEHARDWALAQGGTIRTEVRKNYACGCDQTAPRPIADDVDAHSVCPSVCNRHGGWNGQWTNQPPAPGSVCGCNTCPVN